MKKKIKRQYSLNCNTMIHSTGRKRKNLLSIPNLGGRWGVVDMPFKVASKETYTPFLQATVLSSIIMIRGVVDSGVRNTLFVELRWDVLVFSTYYADGMIHRETNNGSS